MKKLKTIKKVILSLIIGVISIGSGSILYAQTTNFTQVINPGVLTVDIVDGSYVSVPSPSVTFPPATFSFSCQSSTGTLGTSAQQIYVRNPDAADNGWTVSLAGSAATALWTSASGTYDFNDTTGSGCSDGADADSRAGRMTVDASVATLSVGNCSGCTTTGITKGSSAAFSQGSVDSITLLNAAAGSDDIGDFTLQGVSVVQTIPAEQPAASDYQINMVVSILSI